MKKMNSKLIDQLLFVLYQKENSNKTLSYLSEIKLKKNWNLLISLIENSQLIDYWFRLFLSPINYDLNQKIFKKNYLNIKFNNLINSLNCLKIKDQVCLNWFLCVCVCVCPGKTNQTKFYDMRNFSWKKNWDGI